MSYRVYSDSITYQEYSLSGMFLYSHRTIDMRNVSIFTEPQIMQNGIEYCDFCASVTGQISVI